jgi:hypothetical protein
MIAGAARAQDMNSNLQRSNLDFTQDTISKNLFKVTNKIDGYFGDKVPLEEKNKSSITLEYATTVKEESVQTSEPDVDIKVRFKQLENKLRFKFNSVKTDEDETLQNQQETAVTKENVPLENNIYRASIGFLKEQKKYWSISFDTGIKIESSLNPFAKARGRRSFYFGENELRLVNRVFIEDIDGMSNYTDINVNRKLARDFSFKYANKFVWKDRENEFITSHGPSVYQDINDKQSISYNIRTRFINKPAYGITGHEVYSVYRRDLYKRWIFLELIPGVSYLTEKDYTRTGFFTAKLQALFGDF